MKIKEKRYTTGDIAREVGCDDLTVRRFLEEHNILRRPGEQYRFKEEHFQQIVDRMKQAHIRYPKHIRRFEKTYKGNQRIPLFQN